MLWIDLAYCERIFRSSVPLVAKADTLSIYVRYVRLVRFNRACRRPLEKLQEAEKYGLHYAFELSFLRCESVSEFIGGAVSSLRGRGHHA